MRFWFFVFIWVVALAYLINSSNTIVETPKMECEDIYVSPLDIPSSVTMSVCIRKRPGFFENDHYCYISFIEKDPIMISCVAD